MIKRLIASTLVACGSSTVSTSPPPPGPATSPAPADHQIHVTETPQAGGLRLLVSGTSVPLETLGVPAWLIVPMHGAFDLTVDLHMPRTTHRDFHAATGYAVFRCNGCSLGGGSPPGTGTGTGSDALTFPTITASRLEARIVFADGHADVTSWTLESKDVQTEVKAHADLADMLESSPTTVCLRLRRPGPDLTSDVPIARALASAGIAIDTRGFMNIQLTGPLGTLAPAGFGCDGATPPARLEPAPPPTGSDADGGELDHAIVVIDGTHRKVTRALVTRLLANPMAALERARIVPAMEHGKPVGFKLYAIRPRSLLARLGLANGDTLVRVNGLELSSADDALQVYTKLRAATSVELELVRLGKPVTIAISITE
jgi:hypothetical protein